MLDAQDRRQLFLTLAGMEDARVKNLRSLVFAIIQRVVKTEGTKALQQLFKSDKYLLRVAEQEIPKEYQGMFPVGVAIPTYQDILKYLAPSRSSEVPTTSTVTSAATRSPSPFLPAIETSSVPEKTPSSSSEVEEDLQDELTETPRRKVLTAPKRSIKPRLLIKPVPVAEVKADDVDMDSPDTEEGPSATREPSHEV